MSKMGEELEKRLDAQKYEMYNVLKKAVSDYKQSDRIDYRTFLDAEYILNEIEGV